MTEETVLDHPEQQQYEDPNEEYSKLQEAFAYLNKELFDNRLPPVLFVFGRKRNALGYFWQDKWGMRNVDYLDPDTEEDPMMLHEIALNPDTFSGRTDMDILSTLTHEMCHLQQACEGSPGKNGYHNKEWGQMMEDVGLIPSDTAQEGGKKTGTKVSHYIQPGGPFESVALQLLETGFKFSWQSRRAMPNTKQYTTKTKFVCTACGAKAWGKDNLKIVCGSCDEEMQPQ